MSHTYVLTIASSRPTGSPMTRRLHGPHKLIVSYAASLIREVASARQVSTLALDYAIHPVAGEYAEAV